MRRRRARAVAETLPQGSAETRDRMADADALVIGQGHRAMLALPALARELVNPRGKRHRLLLDACQEADSGARQAVAQIVMRAEYRPRRCLATNDPELDGWAGSKQPPGKQVLG